MMNRLRTEAVGDQEAARRLETAREADRQWRATHLAEIAARVRPLLRLADRVERQGTLVVMCLFLATGSALIFFGIDHAGPYFSLIPLELVLGVLLAVAGLCVPTQFVHLATRLRAQADALLKREGLTAGDLPSLDE